MAFLPKRLWLFAISVSLCYNAIMKKTFDYSKLNIPIGNSNPRPSIPHKHERLICSRNYDGKTYTGYSWRQMILNFIRLRCEDKYPNVQRDLIAFISERVDIDVSVHVVSK